MAREVRRDWHYCEVATTLDVMGGRWKAVILFHLMDGTKRFSELARKLPGVTQRMLTLQLRELQRDGVIERAIYAEMPPRVEYSLTEFGHTLTPVLIAMRDWGRSQRAILVARREAQRAA
jgi:DNA-binding HxlR family transcriptional regulator